MRDAVSDLLDIAGKLGRSGELWQGELVRKTIRRESNRQRRAVRSRLDDGGPQNLAIQNKGSGEGKGITVGSGRNDQ